MPDPAAAKRYMKLALTAGEGDKVIGKDGTLSKAAIRAAKKAGQQTARYLPADPEFRFRQCALAGINLVEHAERLMILYDGLGPDREQAEFLESWLHATPGGADAVRSMLKKAK
jgi:hypothetical protein